MRTRSKPYPVTIGGKTKFICGCGLSANQPFCGGTHKKTLDEKVGTLCWCDADVVRHKLPARFPTSALPASDKISAGVLRVNVPNRCHFETRRMRHADVSGTRYENALSNSDGHRNLCIRAGTHRGA